MPGQLAPAIVEEAYQLPRLDMVFLDLCLGLLEPCGLVGAGRGCWLNSMTRVQCGGV